VKADVGLIQFADIGPDDPRLAADILPVRFYTRERLSIGAFHFVSEI
jgi:hypothetical protein